MFRFKFKLVDDFFTNFLLALTVFTWDNGVVQWGGTFSLFHLPLLEVFVAAGDFVTNL